MTTQPHHESLRADLVLEGGGVKGMAFVGALDVLIDAGYTFPRIAGTSAGAVTGSVLAALGQAGEPLARIRDISETLDLSRIRDHGEIGRALGPLHALADAASLLFEGGLYEGDYLHDWLSGVLGDLGVSTFGDLRRDDPGSGLPVEREYAFVAVVSDLSTMRMSLLPWDYPVYELDPDEQDVATAVRASASIPFVFEPVVLDTPRGGVTLVDGGVLSNYPITVFDQPGTRPSRWPTIGVRLSARESDRTPTEPVTGPFHTAIAVVETAIAGWDARHVDDPEAEASTIFVDTGGFSSLDFDLSAERRDALVDRGRRAAERFLARGGGQT